MAFVSHTEAWKQEKHPLDVVADIHKYAKKGFDSIARDGGPGEFERFKWLGLYHQKPAGYFMMRVKVPNGVLKANQARVIGEVAEEFAQGPYPSPTFGNGYVDITTRQGLQMHWLRIEDIPTIWERFEQVGLTTIQACGDGPRNVVGCPVAGLHRDEVFDAFPVAEAVSGFFTGNREYANLPRKFKIGITGCSEDCIRSGIHCLGLTPAIRREGDRDVVGFNVRVGGGLAAVPRFGSDLDLFVRPEDALEICRAVVEVFRDQGRRDDRRYQRLKFLVEEWGVEKFRAEVAKVARIPLTPAGESQVKRRWSDHTGVHAQKQPGLNYVGLHVLVGRLSGKTLIEVDRLAGEYGNGEVRLTIDQNLIVPHIADEKLETFLQEPVLGELSPDPGPIRRGVVACTGNEFCNFSLVETKARALDIIRYLDERLDFSGSDVDVIRINVSGCPASCAQPQIADIALRGEIHKSETALQEAFDVGLGGGLGQKETFVSWVKGKVPADVIAQRLERLLREFLTCRQPSETFQNFCRRMGLEHLTNLLSEEATNVYG